MHTQFSTIPAAIEALQKGEFVVVVDDPRRENEGDLFLAAQHMTPEKMAFLLRHTSGVVCAPLSQERADALDLPPMVTKNTEAYRTAFTVSVDYRHGTTTGISANDRTLTFQALANPTSQPQDFRRPGHVFPLCAKEGGVLKRPGHTEACVDLLQMSGLEPVGVICEMVNADYSMSRVPELSAFAQKHDFPFVTIADLVNYRLRTEKCIRKVSQARLPTSHGEFKAVAYESLLDGVQHLVLIKGELDQDSSPLVRVHSECLTGDLFHSQRCDCGEQLESALESIAKEKKGILIYLRGHEGRGIGLGHKLQTYMLQDEGFDTVDANLHLGLPVDARDYAMAFQILKDLRLEKIRLLTNNPKKYFGLSSLGIDIVERIPLISIPTRENLQYLITKQLKMGHLFEFGPFQNEETPHAHSGR